MRLQKIEIRNFRGFPGPQIYTFELNSKNLLLYGENGSGKSTLFLAISEFFDINHHGHRFSEQRNLFSDDVGGEIKLQFDDNKTPASWNALTERPFGDPRVAQTALRTACLDYRALLSTSFLHSGNEVNLFDLLINYLLANYTVAISGGVVRPIRALWEHLGSNIPRKNTQKLFQLIDDLCDEFNNILALHLPLLEKEAEKLLAYFSDCKTVLRLKPARVIYNRDERRLDNQKILLEVDFNNRPIPAHQHILNEARLSAIALSIYLASAKMSIPPDLPGTPASLKLLVLDDIVIGLDLSNRLPLLDILQKEFADWQILLMTYDKVWFDMVRMHCPDWTCQEIYATPSLIPVHKSRGDYLEKAREHLINNDDHAAAVYTRAEFERRLKKYCEKLRVKISYKQPPDSPDTGEMLDAFEKHLKDDPKWNNDPMWQAEYPPMLLNLRAERKVVLNPLSHAHLVTVTRAEIQRAIDAVGAFRLL